MVVVVAWGRQEAFPRGASSPMVMGGGSCMALDIARDTVLQWVRDQVIGRDAMILTPLGLRRKRYFDQTAAGLPFGPVEDIITREVLPMMANTHTEASAT